VKTSPSPQLLDAHAPRATNRRARASDWAFDDLALRICRLDLAPGVAISESDLANHYGMSRTPVRAAVASLAEIGLVHVTPQVGTRVSLIDLNAVEQAQFIRESLEINALTYACAAQDRDFSAIEAIVAEQHVLATSSDSEAFFLSDEAFHQETFELAGFGGAWAAAGNSRFQLDRIRRLSIAFRHPYKLDELCSEHEELLEHIRSRDLEKAAELLKKHIRRYMIDGPVLQKAYPNYFTGHSATPPN